MSAAQECARIKEMNDMGPTPALEQYPHLATAAAHFRPQPAKRQPEAEPAHFHVDRNGQICECNVACEALFAYARGELLGQPISLLFPELRDAELWVNGQPNPHLRFLCRLGRHFRAVTGSGADFFSELYLNFLDNPGHPLVSVIVRPVRESADEPAAPVRTQPSAPVLRVVTENGIAQPLTIPSGSGGTPSGPAPTGTRPTELPPEAAVSERANRHAGQGTLILDIDGIVRYADATAGALLGAACEQLRGCNVADLLPALFLHAGTRGYNAAFVAFNFGHGEWMPCEANSPGSPRPLACTAAFLDGEGMSPGFAVHLRADGEGEYRAEADFRRLQASLDECGQAAFITDAEGRLVYINLCFASALGYERDELLDRPIGTLQGRLEQLRASRSLANQIREGRQGPILLDLRRKDGRPWRQEASMRPFQSDGANATHYVFTGNGAASRRGVLRNLERMANHDFLTGLPNRRLFLDRLAQAVARAARHQRKFAVLYLDLDGFKEINDQQGHAEGDTILRSVGQVLGRCVRAEDTIARIGGDEFVCIVSDIHRPEDTTTVCDKILDSLRSTPAAETGIGGSIGVAVYPDDGCDEMTLLKHADQAMYLAKRCGGSRYLMFSEVPAGMVE